MAYKFQIGAAKLSGSVQLTDGSIDGTSVDDATAANIVSQIDAGEIAIAKLAASTISGKALGTNLDALAVDDSSIEYSAGSAYNGSAASTIRVKASGVTNAMLAGSIANAKLANSTISGVALGSNLNSLSKATNGGVNFSSYNGSAAVSNLQLDLSDLAAAAVNVGADSIAIYDADADVTGQESIADLMTAVAGNGLAASSGVLAVGVDDSSIELNSDALRVKASGVTNAMLAGSIANAKLANDGITIAGSDTSLGGSITAAAILNTDMGGAFTIGSQSDDVATFSGGVVIAGNLTVQGSAVEVQQGFVVTSSVQFEGSTPDGNEISLTSADPSADRTITLPDLSGHVPLLADAASAASIAVTAAEFALLDGATSRGVSALADGDGFMHNDNGTMKQTNVLKMFEYTVAKVSGDVVIADTGAATIQANAVEGSMLNNNIVSGLTDIGAAIVGTDEMIVSDNGTIRRTDMSRLKTFIGNGTAAVASFGDSDATLIVGVNFASANMSAIRTLTLPASPSVGESVKIKAAGMGGASIIIARAGSQTIDGSFTSIVLESDNAAVELVYVASDDWRVF
tara:strand:- start:2870 stop:4588 length:1719 start_codon:yes stop_codon:yes gene_type:complete